MILSTKVTLNGKVIKVWGIYEAARPKKRLAAHFFIRECGGVDPVLIKLAPDNWEELRNKYKNQL